MMWKTNCPLDEMSVGSMSVRQTVRSSNCQSTKYRFVSVKCSSTIEQEERRNQSKKTLRFSCMPIAPVGNAS